MIPAAIPDERDTIAAAASPPGAGARGVVRLSGPAVAGVVQRLTGVTVGRSPRRFPEAFALVPLHDREVSTPCDLFVWPGTRSYTRQPSAELHTIGSPPVVDALVEAACRAGARRAEPGEFTLRAFLAGRVDLVQAEAVLGVIDAAGDDALASALEQLAGGLSAPLQSLRSELLYLLAELEAGLDFVEEEDVRFLETEELLARLAAASGTVADLAEQSAGRGVRSALPRVVLAGPPNAGKSSLFNALRQRYGAAESTAPGSAGALVSPVAGTTRDSLRAEVAFGGVAFELVDTAGRPEEAAFGGVDAQADRLADRDTRACDLRVLCSPADRPIEVAASVAGELAVATKADAGTPGESSPLSDLPTSSRTGEGLEPLMHAIARELTGLRSTRAGFVAATADRCRESLGVAATSLAAAAEQAGAEQQELVAAELRVALEHLGRVTGEVATEDLLDHIFSKFCIGK